MLKILIVTLCTLMLWGCSDPKATIVPTQLDKMAEIKPSIDKLTEEERELFRGYLGRHIGVAMFGILAGTKVAPIPEGVTIGSAILEQKEFVAKAAEKEATEKELKARVEAERKGKLDEFSKLLTVVVVGKTNSQGEYRKRFVTFEIAFANKSQKDIAGVKGKLKIMDMFGDEVMNMNWGFEQGIAARTTLVERGSGLDVNQFIDSHMKVWNTDYDKLKFEFEVKKIVFKDGSICDIDNCVAPALRTPSPSLTPQSESPVPLQNPTTAAYPRFEDFPSPKYTGEISIPKGITRVDGEWLNEIGKPTSPPLPNFAGKYNITLNGCGTGCRFYTFYDLSTGKSFPALDIFSTMEPPPKTKEGHPYLTILKFRLESNMIVAQYEVENPIGMECRERVFLFENEVVRPITNTKFRCSKL